jgi:outer membrane lipoprotein carrier protein
LRTRLHIFVMAVLLSALICCQALAQDPAGTKEAILAGIEKRYAGKSFSARFSQISRLAALEITDKASGKAFFSHPGKMAWEYETPESHRIITNGKLLWIYRPDEQQVMTGDASQFFKSGAGGAFLSDISLIRSGFDIQVREEAADYFELELTNRKKQKDLDSIVIRVAKKTFEIIRVVTRNPYDDTNLFEFSDIRFHSIDPDKFNFQAPVGTSEIEME